MVTRAGSVGAGTVVRANGRMGGDELYCKVAEALHGSAVSAGWLTLRHDGRALPRLGLGAVGLFDGMVLHAARRDLVGP